MAGFKIDFEKNVLRKIIVGIIPKIPATTKNSKKVLWATVLVPRYSWNAIREPSIPVPKIGLFKKI